MIGTSRTRGAFFRPGRCTRPREIPPRGLQPSRHPTRRGVTWKVTDAEPEDAEAAASHLRGRFRIPEKTREREREREREGARLKSQTRDHYDEI